MSENGERDDQVHELASRGPVFVLLYNPIP